MNLQDILDYIQNSNSIKEMDAIMDLAYGKRHELFYNKYVVVAIHTSKTNHSNIEDDYGFKVSVSQDTYAQVGGVYPKFNISIPKDKYSVELEKQIRDKYEFK